MTEKKGQLYYAGVTLGIIKEEKADGLKAHDGRVYKNPKVSDRFFYMLPGTVENATSFDFPVQYWPVEFDGIGPKTVDPDPNLGRKVTEQAKELERQGVKLVSTDCGFYAIVQKEAANALNVPFCSGGLMPVPLVSRLIGSNKRVGILTWDSRVLTKNHLAGAGIDETIKYAIIGYETYLKKRLKEGSSTGVSKLKMLEDDLVDATKKLIAEYPDIGAIVLECTAFPPAAHAIWKATGLPVFDVVGLLNWIGKSVVRQKGA